MNQIVSTPISFQYILENISEHEEIEDDDEKVKKRKISYPMYHPSTTSLTHDMTTLATSSNLIPHPSTFTSNPFFNPNAPVVPPSPTSRYTFANLNVSSPSIPLDLQRWNYQRFLSSNFKTDSTMSDHHSRNGSFHRYSSRPPTKSSYSTNDNDLFLNKFYHDTLVHLENNETKNIQHLTSNDFLVSAKQSSQYSR